MGRRRKNYAVGCIMSDSRARIELDEIDYIRLCKKYDEKPIKTKGTGDNVGLEFIDCYGLHAQKLSQKERKEETRRTKYRKK